MRVKLIIDTPTEANSCEDRELLHCCLRACEDLLEIIKYLPIPWVRYLLMFTKNDDKFGN